MIESEKPMTKDDDQLNLLSILHFVFSGFSLFSFAITVIQRRMINGMPNPSGFGDSRMSDTFSFFSNLIWLIGLFFLCMFAANIASAYFIGKRRNRSFSLVVAGINSLHFPIGTALGVFCIVVLQKDTVRSLYESNSKLEQSDPTASM